MVTMRSRCGRLANGCMSSRSRRPRSTGRTLPGMKSSRWRYLNIECVDDAGTVYAQFNMHKGLTAKKVGKMELLPPCTSAPKALVDEIVVTGLADVYLQLTQTLSANSAAGVSAAVSV
ncbi:hypothetical protein BJX99DRAFT_233084 [Aspergillus californicus]